MKNFFFCLFAVLCLSTTAKAQTNGDSKNNTAFFGEFGGPGILFSANLDKRFTPSRFGVGGRIGLGFVTTNKDEYNSGGYYDSRQQSVVTIPFQLNYIFGKPNSSHGLEIGIGGTYVGKKIDVFSMFNNGEGTQYYTTFSFKYRRVPVDGGFTWNIGFSPLLAKGIIVPFAGVGFGFAF